MWPPDVGGPASHAPELCGFLLARGHRVAAVTMADATPAGQAYPVHWSSRRSPVGARHAAAAARIARAARGADVVYSTGMLTRSMVGAAAARVPAVVKLTSDPVFERSAPGALRRRPRRAPAGARAEDRVAATPARRGARPGCVHRRPQRGAPEHRPRVGRAGREADGRPQSRLGPPRPRRTGRASAALRDRRADARLRGPARPAEVSRDGARRRERHARRDPAPRRRRA